MLKPDFPKAEFPLIAAAVIVVAAFLTGACDVNTSTGPSTSTKAAVQDGLKVNVDVTKRLTRKEFGFGHDQNFRFIQRPSSGEMLDVTVKTPYGELRTPAFEVGSSTDGAGGLHDKDFSHQPKALDVISRYPDGKQAFDMITKNAEAMGVSTEDIAWAAADVGQGAKIAQSRVLNGFVKDWLSSQITVRDSDDGQVVVLYQFEIDYYHNEAVDKVLQEGQFSVDLTKPASREGLGFLPTYETADLHAEPKQELTIAMQTGRGSIQVQSTAFSSSAASGAGEPTFSFVTVSGPLADIRAMVRAQADALGIDAQAADELFAKRQRVETTLDGVSTSAADLKVKISVNPDPDPKSTFNNAGVVYQIHWK